MAGAAYPNATLYPATDLYPADGGETAPTVITAVPTQSGNSITFGGTVISGDALEVHDFFQWRANGIANWEYDSPLVNEGLGPGTFLPSVMETVGNGQWIVRLVAYNLAGTAYGNEVTFGIGGRMTTVREKPNLRQTVMVETPGGRVYRWGQDSSNPEESLRDLTYGSGMPGGFDQMSATLPRKPNIDYDDLELFSNIQIENAGGEITGEYRLQSAPRTAGNEFSISPNAVGWQAALEDRKDCAEIFVDIELSKWGPVSSTYQIMMGTSVPPTAYFSPEVRPDARGSATVWTGLSSAGTATQPLSMAMYDAGFAEIGSLYYSWQRHETVDNADTDYRWEAFLAENDDLTGAADWSGDLRAAGPDTGTLSAGGTRRYAMVDWGYNIETSGWDTLYGIYWFLAVFGSHGLTKRGVAGYSTAQGFYASDVIEYVVDTYTDLNIGEIDSTTFVIPMLSYREPTTALEMIRGASRFHLFDWFLGPGKKFHWRQRNTYGRNWLARVGPGKLEQTGRTAERCITDVLISYQDVDGTPKYVGPVGSGADTEDASLHDSDPQNPANAAGIAVWATLDMGVSTSAAAIQVGARFLEEINLLDQSGRATLDGWVMDDKGITYPFSSVQAGDTIEFLDAGTDGKGKRRIVKATKAGSSVSIDLDGPPEGGVNALLERLNVQWTNLSGLGASPIAPNQRGPGYMENGYWIATDTPMAPQTPGGHYDFANNVWVP